MRRLADLIRAIATDCGCYGAAGGWTPAANWKLTMRTRTRRAPCTDGCGFVHRMIVGRSVRVDWS